MVFSMLKLTERQFEQIALILSDIGIVVIASTILPSILITFNLRAAILGLISSMILFLLSIKFLKI